MVLSRSSTYLPQETVARIDGWRHEVARWRRRGQELANVRANQKCRYLIVVRGWRDRPFRYTNGFSSAILQRKEDNAVDVELERLSLRDLPGYIGTLTVPGAVKITRVEVEDTTGENIVIRWFQDDLDMKVMRVSRHGFDVRCPA
uniref:ORF5 n=1 Tax=Lentinula edodes negative-strand RNA virus 1 TaxID=2547430 RepID=A0A7S7C442_9MONO|nr:ORF5 [Lentinula edodes negative-strand RNA virus 1]